MPIPPAAIINSPQEKKKKKITTVSRSVRVIALKCHIGGGGATQVVANWNYLAQRTPFAYNNVFTGLASLAK
jgi:hypothetical protein